MLWFRPNMDFSGDFGVTPKKTLENNRIKKDQIRFLYLVQGNGSWERAVR